MPHHAKCAAAPDSKPFTSRAFSGLTESGGFRWACGHDSLRRSNQRSNQRWGLSLAFSPAAQPWRSDRSPSQRRQRRSSAPQSRSSMQRRRPSPATTPRSGSRSPPSPPKAGAMRSPLLARFSSAPRLLPACLCSSRRRLGSGLQARLGRCLWCQRSARGELTPSSSLGWITGQ